jgi:hypothetical protein
MNYLEDFSEQGSHEWKVARIPYITASDMHKVMAKGQGVTRKNYMVKKLCEQLSGTPTPTFKSSYMQDGNDREYIARDIYTQVTGTEVVERGFCYKPEVGIGASVDGYVVGTDGIIEIKNLVATEMIELITKQKIKSEYVKQMQTQMYVLDKKWCDFIGQSLGSEEHGELPDEYKFRIIRVERDEALIAEILAESKKFHEELNQLKEELKKSIKE